MKYKIPQHVYIQQLTQNVQCVVPRMLVLIKSQAWFTHMKFFLFQILPIQVRRELFKETMDSVSLIFDTSASISSDNFGPTSVPIFDTDKGPMIL